MDEAEVREMFRHYQTHFDIPMESVSLGADVLPPLRRTSCKGGEPSGVGFEEVVAKGDDLVDPQLCSRVRIQHCGLIDYVLLAREKRLYGEDLGIQVRSIEGGAHLGKGAHTAGLYAPSIDQAGHLDTSLLRQVRDAGR